MIGVKIGFGKVGVKKDNNMLIDDFNDKHLNEDIFVIGNGPSLANFTDKQLDELKDKITVGVNQSYMLLDTNYFVAGHPGYIAMSVEYNGPNTIRVYPKDRFDYWGDKDFILKTKVRVSNGNLQKPITSNDFMGDSRQISFSAIHLAYVLGAKRIILNGFEERNRLHFYNVIPGMKDKLLDMVDKTITKYDGRNKDLIDDLNAFKRKGLIDNLQNMPWFNTGPGIQLYKRYFEFLNSKNVEVITTVEDSIVKDAGAKFVNIEELI